MNSLALQNLVEGHSPYDVIDAVNEVDGLAMPFGPLQEPWKTEHYLALVDECKKTS